MNNETKSIKTLQLIDNLKEESRQTFRAVKDAGSYAHASFLQGKAAALKNAALMIEAANQ